MDKRSRPKPKAIKGAPLNQGSQVKVAASAYVAKIDYPIFCFRHLVNGYKLEDCDTDQRSLFIAKLVKMAQQSWQTLVTSDHWSGAGFEHMPRKQIVAPLPAIITDDVSKFYVMRFNGKSYRIIGHRSDHIFHVTHIDTKLTAYKH
jgi:hypothetical protein